MSYDNPLRRPITRVSPLIGISQDRKKTVRAKERKETFIRRHTEEEREKEERAWVLARYDAIMRYEHRLEEARKRQEEKKGDRADGEKKRETERIEYTRTRRKETGRGDGERGGPKGARGRGGPVVLPY